MNAPSNHGLLAEFDDADQLLDAVRRARSDGNYSKIDVYSPFAVPGMQEALGLSRDRIPLAMLCGAAIFGGGTYLLEWYSAVIDYPINVGGRPLFSWPAFLPPALEMLLLGAALFGVIALLFASRLPHVWHPLFSIPPFERATDDRFFLLLRSDDPCFDAWTTRKFLETLAPLSINEVAE